MSKKINKLQAPDGVIYEIEDASAQSDITSLKAEVKTLSSGKSDTSHNHDNAYDAKGAANTALASAKTYADGIKNDLLNGAGTAYDTLKELGDLIDDNTDAIEALETVAAGKANTSDLLNYLPLAGGTMTGELRVNGGDAVGGSKLVLETGTGQITNSGTQTLFGFGDSSQLLLGHTSYTLTLRGNQTRPAYNGKGVAFLTEVTALETRLATLENSVVAVLSGTAEPTSDIGEDGDIYLVTE